MSLNFALLCAFALAAMAAAANPAQAANPVVVIETNHGTIEVELFADKTPGTVKNFLGYVDDKFYDGLVFHRVIEDFMIQGGGFRPGMKKKETKAPIPFEAGVSNERGTIAMARVGEDVGPVKAVDSATSQFFINVADNSTKLDKPKYCAFGKVTAGMDVVDKIRKVATGDANGYENVPTEDVVIKSIKKK